MEVIWLRYGESDKMASSAQLLIPALEQNISNLLVLVLVDGFHFHYYFMLSFNNMFVCFQTPNSLVPWSQDDFQLHSRQ